jgi:FkbM family methyltransferase
MEELLSEDTASAKLRERSTFEACTAPFGKSLVLLGTGLIGRRTLAGLRKVGIEPLAYLDNNPGLWNTSVDGLQVLSPKEGADRFADKCAFVVTIWNHGHRFACTRNQLNELGCSKVVSFVSLWWKYPDIFPPHYFLDLPHKILESSEEIRNAFALWADDASRNEYVAQLKWRLWLDFDALPDPIDQEQYFADDLFALSPNEVFVDCGAFDGDTLKGFLRRRNASFGRIVALEPDPVNFRNLQDYVSSLSENITKKITILNLAAGATRKKVRFNATGTPASAVSAVGDLEVECRPLDEILDDMAPSYIKIDIEGVELDAISGAQRSIEECRPILAACVYHCPDHLWRIPLLAKLLCKEYSFFLRPYSSDGWDLICYMVPVERLAVLVE